MSILTDTQQAYLTLVVAIDGRQCYQFYFECESKVVVDDIIEELHKNYYKSKEKDVYYQLEGERKVSKGTTVSQGEKYYLKMTYQEYEQQVKMIFGGKGNNNRGGEEGQEQEMEPQKLKKPQWMQSHNSKNIQKQKNAKQHQTNSYPQQLQGSYQQVQQMQQVKLPQQQEHQLTGQQQFMHNGMRQEQEGRHVPRKLPSLQPHQQPQQQPHQQPQPQQGHQAKQVPTMQTGTLDTYSQPFHQAPPPTEPTDACCSLI